ncbi:hypothetical protein HJC23_006365 [Cyclotella cryptica]|uniref:Uncharacterized protein n=1 Tax=Cyclotella cryptica TaxID=29204 RepID=A0ABD3Q5A2_9STRA
MQQQRGASKSKKATSIPQHRDSLDEILDSDDNNLRRRRRVKRAPSGQTQHGELLVFIRVFVSVILLSAIICIVVAFLFWMLYNISTYISFLGLFTNNDTSSGTSQLDATFVPNIEEIRRVLELARTQYDALSRDNTVLHSVRTEEDLGLFESIPHPANPSIHISVPRFYASVTVNGGDSPSTNKHFREFTSGKLLTPDLTSIVGQSISANEENHPFQRTIFVSLLSNNDQFCPFTVANIFNAASNPERIRIAIVDRTDSSLSDYIPCDEPMQPCESDPEQILCKFNKNVDVYELRSDLDAGAIFSRHIANRMYRGEYYSLQVGYDASVAFSLGWDDELIQQHEATANEMAILTTYLSDATYDRELVDTVEARPERITLCHASFEGSMPNRRLMHLRRDQVEQVPSTSRRDAPLLQPYWSSELSFSRGHFILNVPNDPIVCGLDEQDEEISLAVRAFTHGYDFYTPIKSVVFRYRQHESDIKSSSLSANARRSPKSNQCGQATIIKSRHLLDEHLESTTNEMLPSDVYGLGSVRTMQQFYKCFGIHMNEHITEHRLCDFVVSGNMHDEFTPHLRSDGIGIDYSKINFRFHELISIHKDSEKMS